MKVTVRHVQEIVAEHFEVPLSIMGQSRFDPQSPMHLPRHVAMYFARRLPAYSYLGIARMFRRKDHTTVMHAEHKIAQLCATDPSFAAEIRALEQTIGSGPTRIPIHPQNRAAGDTFVSFLQFAEAA